MNCRVDTFEFDTTEMNLWSKMNKILCSKEKNTMQGKKKWG